MAASSHIHQVIKSCWNFQDKQIPNFSRPSTLFPKQFKDLFSCLKFKDFSKGLISRPAQEPWLGHRATLSNKWIRLKCAQILRTQREKSAQQYNLEDFDDTLFVVDDVDSLKHFAVLPTAELSHQLVVVLLAVTSQTQHWQADFAKHCASHFP